MEGIVHEGWLMKSPPEKRILKAKWRQRWFVLRHSGLLPGQFILEYFTDSSCKKLKGKIDLDQCEQVDAGLTFEGKKTNYQYMFDIRTPKRIYYLVAETESNMNKWVECICSVCGLKMHEEEDYLSPLEKSRDATVVTMSPSSSHCNTQRLDTSSNPPVKRSDSNPYIPISECHTGKPVVNGTLHFEENYVQIIKEVPLSSSNTTDRIHDRSASDEYYDHPRPINSTAMDERNMCSEINLENMYKVPLQLKPPVTTDMDNAYNTMLEGKSFRTLPPRVNWHTYPNGSFQSATLGRLPQSKTDVVYDQVPPVHNISKDVCKKGDDLTAQLENISLKNSCVNSQPSSTQREICQQKDVGAKSISKVPPRPPKPSKLREKRNRYENFELPVQTPKMEDSLAYDVPPPALKTVPDNQQVSQTVSSLKGESSDELSPFTKVPLPSASSSEAPLDDTYDFPKLRTEDNINATVPAPAQASGTSQRQRCHAYSNAPPGLFNSKELIFNYEYRPSLNTSDSYISMGSNKPEVYTSMASDVPSPQTPTIMGAYANVPTSPSFVGSCQSDTPPAVNRELKPKKHLSAEERSTGSFSLLALQPPPVCRSRSKSNKRSFRKPRAGPSPTPGSNGTPPPVPNRFRHHHELSATSDDDLSSSGGSRRNSSNDEQGRLFFPASKKDEIQYLDLDLDSEPSQSPKSPERLTASTVYKKVDFVKTKAFNEMRQNVEESYRKSQ